MASAVPTALPSETLHLHKQRPQEHRDKQQPSNMATTDEQKKAILPFLQVRHVKVFRSLRFTLGSVRNTSPATWNLRMVRNAEG